MNREEEAKTKEEKEVVDTLTQSPSSSPASSPTSSWFDFPTMNGVELIFNTKGIIRTFFTEETKSQDDPEETLLLTTSGSTSTSTSGSTSTSTSGSSSEDNTKLEADTGTSTPCTHSHAHRSELSASARPSSSKSTPVSFSLDRTVQREGNRIIHFDSDSDSNCDGSNCYTFSSKSNISKAAASSSGSESESESELSCVEHQHLYQRQSQQNLSSPSLEDTSTIPSNDNDGNSYNNVEKKFLTMGNTQPGKLGKLLNDNDNHHRDYQSRDNKEHKLSKKCLSDDIRLEGDRQRPSAFDVNEISQESLLLVSCSSLTSMTSIKTTKTDDSIDEQSVGVGGSAASNWGRLVQNHNRHYNEHRARRRVCCSATTEKTIGWGGDTGNKIKTDDGSNSILNLNLNSNSNKSAVTTSMSIRSNRRSCLAKPSIVVRAPSSSSVRFKDVKPSIEDHLVRARALLNNARDLRKRLDIDMKPPKST